MLPGMLTGDGASFAAALECAEVGVGVIVTLLLEMILVGAMENVLEGVIVEVVCSITVEDV